MLKHYLPLAMLVILVACSGPSRGELEDKIKDLLKRQADNMVHIKGGTFELKINDSEYEQANAGKSKIKRKFTITLDDFSLSKYEITCEEFKTYLAASKKTLSGQDWCFEPQSPMGNVSWKHANDYCNWLSSLSGESYRLPTESQWVYAATSGGRDVLFATNNGKYEPGKNAEHNTKTGEVPFYPEPVGKYPPNPLGIYGMTGGVEEWVYDWYDVKYFLNQSEKNPMGPKKGTGFKATKGDHFSQIMDNALYRRNYDKPNYQVRVIGFRCAKY